MPKPPTLIVFAPVTFCGALIIILLTPPSVAAQNPDRVTPNSEVQMASRYRRNTVREHAEELCSVTIHDSWPGERTTLSSRATEI
jgi:hypothetical protein